MNTGERVIGIDPGLHTTGYAVIEASGRTPAVREAGIIQDAVGHTSTDMVHRLRSLYTGIMEVIDQFHPTVMAVEQLYAHYKHPRTAILMGHARGVILLAASERSIPVVSYNATRIKKTVTGNGRAPKEQVQRTIQRELRLAKLPEPPDVADAIAIALCHYYVQAIPGKVTQ